MHPGCEGEVIEKRIRTERERFDELLEGRARARSLTEASTEREWVVLPQDDEGEQTRVLDLGRRFTEEDKKTQRLGPSAPCARQSPARARCQKQPTGRDEPSA